MKTSEKKLIRSYFYRMIHITESSRENAEELQKINAKEERQHRKFGASFTDGKASFNAPIGSIAEYFTVKQIFDGLTVEYKDFIGLRPSCLFAAGIAYRFSEKINKEFSPAEIESFLELDYCKLIA
jgi:hypothetical protein